MAGYDGDDDNRQNQDDGGYYQGGNDAEPSSYRTRRSSDGRYNQLRPRYRDHGDWSSDVDDLQLPQPLSRQPPRPPPHIYLPGPPQPPPHREFPRRDQPPRPPPHRQATGRDQPPRPPPHRQFTSLARSQQQPQPQPQMPLQSDTWFAEPAEPSPHPQVSGFDYAFAEEQRRRDEEQDRHHQRIMRRVAKVERELRDHFSNMRSYDFESVMARGAYGVTCRIIERSHRGLPRRLIIKRALSTQGVEGLKHEIMVMQKLNGAAHIASVVASIDDSHPLRPTSFFTRMRARARGRQNAFLIGLHGPALVIEFLEHGTLTDLIQRVYAAQRMLPNRVLWGFFLCLTRACIGMEWPKNRPANTSVRLEKIPRDPTERRGFWAHCDMHTSNVLIGKIDSFREHNSVPPVKLIDFGLARQCSEAMQRNIRDIAVVMVEIITGKFQPDLLLERTVYRDVATMATPLLPGPDGRFLFPSLNQCLRNLLILCLAVELADRPSLQDALATAERAVMGGEVELLGPDMDLETDEEIRRVVQELIYDR